jgi:serine/threonine protein kinase
MAAAHARAGAEPPLELAATPLSASSPVSFDGAAPGFSGGSRARDVDRADGALLDVWAAAASAAAGSPRRRVPPPTPQRPTHRRLPSALVTRPSRLRVRGRCAGEEVEGEEVAAAFGAKRQRVDAEMGFNRNPFLDAGLGVRRVQARSVSEAAGVLGAASAKAAGASLLSEERLSQAESLLSAESARWASSESEAGADEAAAAARSYYQTHPGFALADEAASGSGAWASRFRTDFVVEGEVGKGSFSTVFRCRHRLDGALYAVKRCDKRIRGAAHLRLVLQEVFALAALGCHPHVVRYFGSWVEDASLFIQLEFSEGGSLAQLFGSGRRRFAEAEVLHVLRDVASALAFVHARGVVHLDVKPDNILRCEGRWKLGDFGLARPIDTPPDSISEGDSRYLAREVLQCDTRDLTKGDVFSLGVTAYELASGQPVASRGAEWRRLRDGPLPRPSSMSAELHALLQRMLSADPAQRPTACDLLCHPLLAATWPCSAHDLSHSLQAANEELRRLRELLQTQTPHFSRGERLCTLAAAAGAIANAEVVVRGAGAQPQPTLLALPLPPPPSPPPPPPPPLVASEPAAPPSAPPSSPTL